LTQNIIDLANAQNLPLYTSGPDMDPNSGLVQATKPELIHAFSLNTDRLLFKFLGKGFAKWAAEKRIIPFPV
jgi:hypothetical protein